MADCGCQFEGDERHLTPEEMGTPLVMDLGCSEVICSYFLPMIASEVEAGRTVEILAIGHGESRLILRGKPQLL